MTYQKRSAHRVRTVSGLGELAVFLDEKFKDFPLNEFSTQTVYYHILEKDTEKARAEFESLRAELSEYEGSFNGAVFSEATREDTKHNATQHIANLAFGDGAVSYQVVWIEKGEDSDA